MLKTDVIIIGGGATGACHGLLRSGDRYVVSDPIAARECFDENMILRRIGEICGDSTTITRFDPDIPFYKPQ